MGEVTMKVTGPVACGCGVLSPSYPDVLALREAKQVALRSARVPLAATPAPPATSAPPAIFIYERGV